MLSFSHLPSAGTRTPATNICLLGLWKTKGTPNNIKIKKGYIWNAPPSDHRFLSEPLVGAVLLDGIGAEHLGSTYGETKHMLRMRTAHVSSNVNAYSYIYIYV